MSEKDKFLALIKANIDEYGYHVTIVNSYLEPRYAYTIGLTEQLGFELIFPGGIYYSKNDLLTIFERVANELKVQTQSGEGVLIDDLGLFSLSLVHSSWSELTMLGVYDFYDLEKIVAYQLVPDKTHYTLDIPDMSKEFSPALNSVWQWLVRTWNYPVPNNSTVVTNLAALRGELITEVMRWEENEWEIFSGPGPDVLAEDKRVVSLGTMLGIDSSLDTAIYLRVGKGLWRDFNNLEWNPWG